MDSLHKRLVKQSFNVSFADTLYKLLNRHSSGRRNETLECSSDVNLMVSLLFYQRRFSAGYIARKTNILQGWEMYVYRTKTSWLEYNEIKCWLSWSKHGTVLILRQVIDNLGRSSITKYKLTINMNITVKFIWKKWNTNSEWLNCDTAYGSTAGTEKHNTESEISFLRIFFEPLYWNGLTLIQVWISCPIPS